MDKYLLLLGFQFTQVAALGAIDGSAWRALSTQGWRELLAGVADPGSLGLLLQALASGTWVGRFADLGEFAALLLRGTGGLPLALIVLQWGVLMGLLYAERVMLQRRLQRIAAGN